MPSIGELIRIPFHVTCVCEGDVPRNATVERVARPYCLTKIDVLKVRMSAIESAMFSCNIVVSSWVFWMPISFIGRRAVTLTSRMGTAYEGIIRKSKCSTDFKRNDFLKKTKRTHWVRFVHLNSLIESCVFLYLWNSPFDTFL